MKSKIDWFLKVDLSGDEVEGGKGFLWWLEIQSKLVMYSRDFGAIILVHLVGTLLMVLCLR
jgi:hypothetical protein